MVVGFIAVLLGGTYLVSMLEAWVTTGRLRPARPLLAGLALLGRESVLPRQPDRLLFEVAPPLLLVAAVSAAAVLPLAAGTVVINLATGTLFVNAAWAYVMVALVMAGWGPNGAYAMVAGWRALGQVIAYSMLIVMPITAVAMRAESLTTVAAVESQASAWNIVTQPLGFVLFVLAALALCFLPPFDLPVGSDLAGGVTAEYTGARLAVFRLGRLVLIVTLAAAIVVFYLGGWWGPWLPGGLWTAIKLLAVVAVMLAAGRIMPRLREADVLAWSWQYGIPLALVYIAWVGITLLI